MECFHLRIRNLPSHKKPEIELLSICFNTANIYHSATCKNSGFRLFLLKSLTENNCSPESWISTEPHILSTTCFTGLLFFSCFYLGKYYFHPPPHLPSPPSGGSCFKGNLQSRHGDSFVCTPMPAWLMPWPWLWEWRLGSQPAGAASAAFSFLEPGRYHTKKTLSSLRKVATLCGKIKLLHDIPFKFTMAHTGSSIQYFLPAICNQGSQTACFVSGFWVRFGMKGRLISFYYYFFFL